MGSNLRRVCRGGRGKEERIRDYIHNHSDANERCARVHGTQAIALKPRGEEPPLLLLPGPLALSERGAVGLGGAGSAGRIHMLILRLSAQ